MIYNQIITTRFMRLRIDWKFTRYPIVHFAYYRSFFFRHIISIRTADISISLIYISVIYVHGINI